MRYIVQDGVFPFTFDGELLAESSSQIPGKTRWVEFALYRTEVGNYVLSRIGKSLLYHKKVCKTVSRNNLKATTPVELEPNAVLCSECGPLDPQIEEVFPETPRYFAQKTTTAKGVLAAVMQHDDNNSEYLTNVAKRLLLDASEKDSEIRSVLFGRIIE